MGQIATSRPLFKKEMKSFFGILTTPKVKKFFGTHLHTFLLKLFYEFGPMPNQQLALPSKMDFTTTLQTSKCLKRTFLASKKKCKTSSKKTTNRSVKNLAPSKMRSTHSKTMNTKLSSSTASKKDPNSVVIDKVSFLTYVADHTYPT